VPRAPHFFIMTQFIISILSVAGFTVIWRNWINDHPKYKIKIENILGSYKKVLLCGSCFTYWISLIFTIINNPLKSMWGDSMYSGFYFIASWMALSYGAVFARFLYILIQENVHNLVHNHNHHH